MQAALCVSLAMTIAIASWVDQSRATALAVAMGQPQGFYNDMLNLNLRLPEGWKLKTIVQTDEAFVVATEVRKIYGTRRTVTVLLKRLRRSMTPKDLADQMERGRLAVGSPRPFDFLGQRGIVQEYPLEHGESDDGTPRMLMPALQAAAVLPAERLGVIVQLQGVRSFAPADWDLLRSVAQSLALMDSAHPPPPLPDTGPVDQPDRMEPSQEGNDDPQ